MQHAKSPSVLTGFLLVALISAATAQEPARRGFEGYQNDRSRRAGIDERREVRERRYRGGIVDGIENRYFPFEATFRGYKTPFEDDVPTRGYRGPFDPDYGYRFDGDRYGYGGYDFGYSDLGYHESPGLEPVYRRQKRPILSNENRPILGNQ